MKTPTKLALAAAVLTIAFAAQAQWANGYYRSDGAYATPYSRPADYAVPYDAVSYAYYRAAYASYQQAAYAYAPAAYSPTLRYASDYRAYASPVSVYASSARLGNAAVYAISSPEATYVSATVTTIRHSTVTWVVPR